VLSLNSHDTLQYDAGPKRLRLKGLRKTNRTASLAFGQFCSRCSLREKTLKVRSLSDCTIAFLYTPVMAFRSMCKRFEEKRVEKEEEDFQDSSVQSFPRKVIRLLNKRCADCE
jgi:hypothetical protein